MTPTRLAGIALLAVLGSCGGTTGPRQILDLRAARQQWHAQNLHSYTFTLQRSCFCVNTDPLSVVVLNDTVATVVDIRTGQQVDKQLGETVDGLFDFIQSAIGRHAHLIRATYDEAKGFPAEIDYDASAQAADDELFVRASDVRSVSTLD